MPGVFAVGVHQPVDMVGKSKSCLLQAEAQDPGGERGCIIETETGVNTISFSGSIDVVIPALKELRAADDLVKELDRKLDRAKKDRAAKEEEAFLLMEREDVQNITLEDKMFFRKVTKIYGYKQPGVKEQAQAWLKKNGFADLFQETVNSRTLGSELKRAVEEDQVELPDDLFQCITKNNVGINKAKQT